LNPVASFLDQVADNCADHASDNLVDQAAIFEVRIALVYLVEISCEQRLLPKLRKAEEACPKAIVDVMIVVGDGVCDVRYLCLKPGLLAVQEALANIAEFACIAC